MSIKQIILVLSTLVWGMALLPAVNAQADLAATLEVRSPGVEVRRVGTEQWIAVQVEAIVGVGDEIRTDGSGSARIIFFADGTETDLDPNTSYRIDEFQGDDTSFSLNVTVLAGQTTQRLGRILDSSSTYDVNTPGVELTARGTVFDVRVEENGRSSMLVREGLVGATANDDATDVDAGFGIRSPVDGNLSDVVQVNSFEELDSALDGCEVSITTRDDVRLNVRLGPSLEFPRVGTIDPTSIPRFFGTVADQNWYRVEFEGHFGWILASSTEITGECALLREFPTNFGGEDPSLYQNLGEDIQLEDVLEDLPEPSTPTEDTGETEEAPPASDDAATSTP